MNISRLAVLAVIFMMVLSTFVAIPAYNASADHENHDDEEHDHDHDGDDGSSDTSTTTLLMPHPTEAATKATDKVVSSDGDSDASQTCR